ncbi:hypothetical protein FJTKL_09966 [Diaporthe vaccinii]|uniref:Uncharacterized protein n=1 Tax=Diaporthe vaccinii TaxID=105482 RepID=A0ABR4EM29_9PEZI
MALSWKESRRWCHRLAQRPVTELVKSGVTRSEGKVTYRAAVAVVRVEGVGRVRVCARLADVAAQLDVEVQGGVAGGRVVEDGQEGRAIVVHAGAQVDTGPVASVLGVRVGAGPLASNVLVQALQVDVVLSRGRSSTPHVRLVLVGVVEVVGGTTLDNVGQDHILLTRVRGLAQGHLVAQLVDDLDVAGALLAELLGAVRAGEVELVVEAAPDTTNGLAGSALGALRPLSHVVALRALLEMALVEPTVKALVPTSRRPPHPEFSTWVTATAPYSVGSVLQSISPSGKSASMPDAPEEDELWVALGAGEDEAGSAELLEGVATLLTLASKNSPAAAEVDLAAEVDDWLGVGVGVGVGVTKVGSVSPTISHSLSLRQSSASSGGCLVDHDHIPLVQDGGWPALLKLDHMRGLVVLLGVLVSVMVRVRLGGNTGSQRCRNGNVKSSLHFEFWVRFS